MSKKLKTVNKNFWVDKELNDRFDKRISKDKSGLTFSQWVRMKMAEYVEN